MSSTEEAREVGEEQPSVEAELEDAKRFFALKEWSQAADGYGEVLELLRDRYEEEDPLFAPLMHRYGHALLEHAIATSGALGGGGGSSGKEGYMPEPKTVASARAKDENTEKEAEKAVAQASSSSASSSKAAGKAVHDPRFTFGGDAEESEEEEAGEGAEKAGRDDEEEEEEDDLGLAFSILELARVRYEKVLAGDGAATMKTIDGEEWGAVTIKSQLAEVLNDLADVGLESENFQQASTDYRSSLEMLTPLLQPHSRRLADAYLRLGLALEFHPDASLQASAEKYVAGATTTLEKRLESLNERQRVLQKDSEAGESGLAKAEAAASELRSEKAEIESEERLRAEGVLKGKERENGDKEGQREMFEKDDVIVMDLDQVEKEQKDVKEMIQELRLKLEEYANAAPGSGSTTNMAKPSSSSKEQAKETLQQAINEALLGASTNNLDAPRLSDPNAPINDLSAMVKKKKKVADDTRENGNGKRKESEGGAEGSGKKPRLDQ